MHAARLISKKLGLLYAFTLLIFFPLSDAAFGEDRYGSIAYSIYTENWGSAVNQSTSAEAKQRAMSGCKKRGANDCRIAVSFRQGNCGAVAVSGFDGTTATARGAWVEKEKTKRRAVKRCGKSSGMHPGTTVLEEFWCRIVVYKCNLF